MRGINVLKNGGHVKGKRRCRKDCFTRQAGACQRQGNYTISRDDLDTLKIYNLRYERWFWNQHQEVTDGPRRPRFLR